jgi:hypothetical protein
MKYNYLFKVHRNLTFLNNNFAYNIILGLINSYKRFIVRKLVKFAPQNQIMEEEKNHSILLSKL